MSTPTRKRSPNWTDNEVNVLLEIWKQYKKQLDSSKRNQSVFQIMSTEMAGYYCYRSADEIRTKIDNLAKVFKYERTQEIVKGTKSEWRFYWPVDDILGLNPNYCVEYIKDSIEKKERERSKENSRATILMFKYPKKEESDEMSEDDISKDVEQEQSHTDDESLAADPEPPMLAAEVNFETEEADTRFLKDLLKEYKETKESLVDTDKKIVELLSNQNDLIKTQNELCQTQNTILKTLLEKME